MPRIKVQHRKPASVCVEGQIYVFGGNGGLRRNPWSCVIVHEVRAEAEALTQVFSISPPYRITPAGVVSAFQLGGEFV